ncbi:hypothetical protein [Persephonella sp. KM09-Lau-8]|uniref:hypothetical protein n=1 Tax=Persephonella sp. KM09-Lau-8 TaxID=1158345 RepID=UPI0004956A3D|nr:hypothetical protein [Persephonella sp. KM09-Lau-8]
MERKIEWELKKLTDEELKLTVLRFLIENIKEKNYIIIKLYKAAARMASIFMFLIMLNIVVIWLFKNSLIDKNSLIISTYMIAMTSIIYMFAETIYYKRIAKITEKIEKNAEIYLKELKRRLSETEKN